MKIESQSHQQGLTELKILSKPLSQYTDTELQEEINKLRGLRTAAPRRAASGGRKATPKATESLDDLSFE